MNGGETDGVFYFEIDAPGKTMKVMQSGVVSCRKSTAGAILAVFLLCLAADGARAGQLVQNLHDAAFMGKVVEARKFIAEGADVNARDVFGSTPLLTAVRPYGEPVVRLLVTSGADVNAAGAMEDTPLFSAARKGLTDIVRMLLEAGADPGYARGDGTTALMEACIFGHREIVALLVEKGADISAKDQFGFTPLSIARKNNHTDIVEYLQSRGGLK